MEFCKKKVILKLEIGGRIENKTPNFLQAPVHFIIKETGGSFCEVECVKKSGKRRRRTIDFCWLSRKMFS